MKTAKLVLNLMLGALAFGPAAGPLQAAQTKVIVDDDFQSFAQGEGQAVAITSDGWLTPSYERSAVGPSGAEIVWDAVREKKGSVLAATGHRGALMRIIDEQTSQTLATLPEPELTAMLRLADGRVLVAAAPGGRIYALATDDTLTTLTTLNAPIVWRMVQGEDGDVWAATGPEGKLMRIHEAKGKEPQVEEAVQVDSSNVLDLWLDAKGQMGPAGALYLATQNPGRLYRYEPGRKAVEVVYNANAEEVRSVTACEQGLLLALNTERSPSGNALSMMMRSEQRRSETGGQDNQQPVQPPADLRSAFSQNQAPMPPRSEIVLLEKSGFSRSLWVSSERPIHCVAASAGGVLAAVGNQGRLFEIDMDGKESLVADVREDYLMRIVPDAQGYLLTAARNGVVFSLAAQRAARGEFVSRPLDAGAAAQWGHAYLAGDFDGQVKASFRTGNDGDPRSDYWGPWSGEQTVQAGQALALPEGAARFLQYKLSLKPKAGDRVRVDYAELYYTQPNAAPVIDSLMIAEAPMAQPKQPMPSVKRNGNGKSAAGPGGPGGMPPGMSGPGGPQGSQPGQSAAGGAVSGRDPRSNSMLFNLMWKASDPDGDTLVYALHYKAQDETAWKLIDDHLTMPMMPLDVSGVADGRYRFRLTASDLGSNPAGQGLSTQKISDEVIIDNTAPVFDAANAHVKGAQVSVRLKISDSLSLLSSVLVDVDNGDAQPLLPADGVFDQASETFEWKNLEKLEPGEHVATFNATDRRGNTSVHKVVFTVDK